MDGDWSEQGGGPFRFGLFCPDLSIFIDLLMGLFRGAIFHHGGVPENCLLALLGRFPSLMGRFPTLMGRFPECLNGPFSRLIRGLKIPEKLRKAPDTFNFLRHVMRAIWSVRPKCSHRCISLKETPLKPVQSLKHTTKNSAEHTVMRTK